MYRDNKLSYKIPRNTGCHAGDKPIPGDLPLPFYDRRE